MIIPPALIISQGMGSITALAWVSIASLCWPDPAVSINNKLFFVIKTQYTAAKPDVRNIGSIKYFSGMKKFKTTAKLPIKNNETSG